jgi:predicted PurR-regulated permease PerM
MGEASGARANEVSKSISQTPRRSSLVFFLVAVALNLWMFRYFLVTLATAASISVLLSSLFERLSAALRGRRSLAAGLATALIAVLILIPIASYGIILVRQAFEVYERVRPPLEPGALSDLWSRDLPERFPWLRSFQEYFGATSLDGALARIAPVLSNLAAGVNQFVQSTLTGFTSAILYLILFLLAMFFLLRDGRRFAAEVFGLLPFSGPERDEMFQSVGRTVKGVLYSMVLVPVAQGLLAVLGFWIFGVPSPIFWGTMLIFAATIPGVGAPLVWLPAAIYIFLASSTFSGVGLLLYGTLVISLVDNLIKPLLLHGMAQIHTFLAFLSLVGGLLTFGPAGFLLGPVTFSLLQSMVKIRQSQQAPG